LSHHRHINRTVPATISFVLSVVCVIAIVFLVHDRWNHPDVKPPEQAEHSTTGDATRKAGAKLVPSEPKLKVQPSPAGPAPVQPANPD
jgi:hypothetical protein